MKHRLATVVALLLAVTMTVAGCSSKQNLPEITVEKYEYTIQEMEKMVALTEAGDVEAGEEAFWRAHPFFHEVDPHLRAADPDFAQELWDNVLRIEFEYFRRKSQAALVKEGKRNLELLPRVRSVLDWLE